MKKLRKGNLLEEPPIIKNPLYNKRIVNLDIETSPNEGTYFELYREGNIVWNIKHWFIMSIAWKYLGEDKVYVKALCDFPEWQRSFCSKCKRIEDVEIVEKRLMKVIWGILDKADVVVGHNSDQFDLKKINAKLIKYGFEPPSAYKQVDTKKVHKKLTNTDSNKLNDIADFYKIGRKVETSKDLHRKCLQGDKKAWEEMKIYNKGDVVLDEKLYMKERGWDTSQQVNMNLILNTMSCCPRCGGEQIIKAGFKYTATCVYQTYRCLNCGHRPQGEKIQRARPELK